MLKTEVKQTIKPTTNTSETPPDVHHSSGSPYTDFRVERSERLPSSFSPIGEFKHTKQFRGALGLIKQRRDMSQWRQAEQRPQENAVSPIISSVDGRLMTASSHSIKILFINPGEKNTTLLEVEDETQIGDVTRDSFLKEDYQIKNNIRGTTRAVVLSSKPVKHPTTTEMAVVETLKSQGIKTVGTMVYIPDNDSKKWGLMLDSTDPSNIKLEIFSEGVDHYYQIDLPQELQKPYRRKPLKPHQPINDTDGQKSYPVSQERHPFLDEELEGYTPYQYLRQRLLDGEEFTPREWQLEVFSAQQAHALGLIEIERGILTIPEDVREPIETRFRNLRKADLDGDDNPAIYLNGRSPDGVQLLGHKNKTPQELFRESAVNPDALTSAEEIDPGFRNRAVRRNLHRLTVYLNEAALINR